MGNKKVQAHKETEIKIIPYYKNLNATKNPIKNKKKLSMGVSKIKTFYQDPAILMALFNQIMKEQNYHHLVIFNPDRLDVHTIMMKDPAISAKEALELALKNSNEWADKVKKLLGECGFVEQKLDYNPNQVENKEKQSLSYTIVNCNDFIKNQYFDKILEITRNFYQQGRIEKDITSNANIFSRSVLMAAKQFAASLESVDQTKDNIEKRIEFHGREYIITELAYMYLFNSVLGCEDTAYPVSDDKKKISKKVFDAFKLLEKEINSHNIGITSNLRLYDIKLEHIKEKNKNSTPPEKFTVNNEQKTSNNKLQKVLIPPQNGQSSVSQVPVKPTMPASRTQIKKRIAVLERKIYRLLERREKHKIMTNLHKKISNNNRLYDAEGSGELLNVVKKKNEEFYYVTTGLMQNDKIDPLIINVAKNYLDENYSNLIYMLLDNKCINLSRHDWQNVIENLPFSNRHQYQLVEYITQLKDLQSKNQPVVLAMVKNGKITSDQAVEICEKIRNKDRLGLFKIAAQLEKSGQIVIGGKESLLASLKNNFDIINPNQIKKDKQGISKDNEKMESENMTAQGAKEISISIDALPSLLFCAHPAPSNAKKNHTNTDNSNLGCMSMFSAFYNLTIDCLSGNTLKIK